MANTPKKVKDPTEVGLSAIQKALNISDDSFASDNERNLTPLEAAPAIPPPASSFSEPGFEPRAGTDRSAFNPAEEMQRRRRPANDDRKTIGQLLQAIQNGRSARSIYTLATIFAGVWIVGCALLTVSFLPSLQAAVGQGSGGALTLATLAALFLVPVLLFYFLASLAWRSQELRMIAQSMAQVAIRFSEPETSAGDSMVTVGQAVRREVTAMGNGIERAIARAGELENLVESEVAALERAFSDNEVRIRTLLQDIGYQRDNLVGEAEQVRSAISGVQLDLRHDVALISDAIASRVDEVTKSITSTLEERGAYITQMLGNAGDTMTLALSERAGDLLARLEEASAQTTRAMHDASERLTSSLNFKTSHVHDEFADLADRVQEMLSQRIDRITAEFEHRSATIVDAISNRTEQVHDTLKNSGDSLLMEFGLRGDDLASKINGAGNRIASRILTSGNKATEALDTTINSLVERSETARDKLSQQMSAFDELVKDQGTALAEKFARDSGTLGALITRHVSEFDLTVKTFGGEVMERVGQRTHDIADTLKNYVEAFEARVGSSGREISGAMDQRLAHYETMLKGSVTHIDTSLDDKLKVLEESLGSHARSVTNSIESRISLLSSSLTDGSAQAIEAIDRRIAGLSETVNGRGAELSDRVTARFQEIHQGIAAKVGAIATDIDQRVAVFEDLLGSRVEAVARRIESSGQEASEALIARTQMLSSSIKSHVDDAERSLTNLAVNTSETIQGGARTAQQSLLDVGAQLKVTSSEVEQTMTAAGSGAANSILDSAREAESSLTASSADAASQIRALSSEIERSLSATTAESTDNIKTSALSVHNSLTSASNEVSASIKSTASEMERSMLGAGSSFGSAMSTTADEIVSHLQQQTDRLSQMMDAQRGPLIDALASKTKELSFEVDRVTSEALKSIETGSQSFSQSMMGSGDNIARTITSAGELAANAVNKSLKDLEQASRVAIEQSRQVSTATLSEMQETSKLLCTDTTALFERLREGNILLQEVLTGAHDNLNELERALVTCLADFVSAMNEVTSRNGAAAQTLQDQIGAFSDNTAKALVDLGSLSAQFEAHGRSIMEAVAVVEQGNQNASASVAERKATLEALVSAIDLRTADLDQRLSRFASLLDQSLVAAEERARDIAHVIAESTDASSAAVTRQFEAVRAASEGTVEAMHDIHRQTTKEADAMFKQSADKFASLVGSMKQMAAEMHEQLEATRNEMRRGVLEMPQEAAQSTAQMRKVIVDQIEALAELNRIVAQHGRGLDVVSQARGGPRQDEQMTAASGGRGEAQDTGTPGPREVPLVSATSADQGRDGSLSDVLSRAADAGNREGAAQARALAATAQPSKGLPLPVPRGRPPQGGGGQSGNPLESLSLDIARLMDRNLAGEMWDRYQRGDGKAFTKRLYTPAGQKAFGEVSRKYRSDRSFKQSADRYIAEFERRLDEVARDDSKAPEQLRGHLVSETGLVYTLLAHATGRLVYAGNGK